MIPVRLPQGYYTATGTLLLRRDSAKDGLSLLLFLRGYGPRWAGAPSAKSKNRFGGSTEPLTWCEYSLYQSATRLYLKAATVKEDFLDLRAMPAALLCALRIYKRAAKEFPANCENDAQLRLLWNALLQLRAKCPPHIVEFRFAWRSLNIMGTAPSLELCAECGQKLTEGGAMTREGMLCHKCAPADEILTDARGIKELRYAVGLPHEKFILWSRGNRPTEPYTLNLKKLSPYFSYMR